MKSPGIHGDRPKLLLIDDEPAFTRLLARALRVYDVCIENDASHAIETARGFHPDLVILDLVMPQVDGADVADKIKRDPELADTRIIILSALIDPNDNSPEFTLYHGLAALGKPVTIETLRRCIQEQLAA